MRPCNFRSLLLAAIVLSNCITWTASKHHFTHNVSGHRSRHRRQGAGLYLSSSYVIPGGDGNGWGEWGQVSPCSRTCGGGVASQKRICLQVSSDGQPQCTGGDTKYFSCETQDCPEGSQDFRAEQCAEYNNKSIGGGIYKSWEPYMNAPNPCELNCMPHGERFYYRHKTAVVDGTRCNEDSFDVCVQGTCQPVGCDMMLGSNAKEDKCRECRGNGANCYTNSDLIDTQDLIKGYNDILFIPQGATNIRIAEVKASINYLALRPSNGSFYLNGNYHIDFPRSIFIAGTTWHYERSQQGFAAPDKLSCLGPITEPLYLSLLLQSENVGIKYEYSLPKSLGPAPVQTYGWIHGDFTPCSASCGGGFQFRNVTCSSSQELKPVDEALCNEALRPVANQTCNLHECPAQWIEGPWSACSKPCGDGGTKSRNVYCQKIITNGDTFSFPSVVADKECFDMLGAKPKLFEKCNEEAICPTWFIGSWTPCDKLCDEGKQTRKVVCRQVTDGKVEVYNDTSCLDEKPTTEQSCMVQPCKHVDWVLSDWNGCDTCLSKNRTRHAECVTEDRVVVNSSFCAYHKTPILEEPCLKEELPKCEVQWYATQWSPCSVVCGKGVQARRVFCGMFNGSIVVPVDDADCANLTKYKDTKPCEIPYDKCPAQWYAGPWPECNKKCGKGEQVRKVMCLQNGEISKNCTFETVMDPSQSCNTQPCENVTSSDDDLDYCDDYDEEHPEQGVDILVSPLNNGTNDNSTDEGSGIAPINDLESTFTPETSNKTGLPGLPDTDSTIEDEYMRVKDVNSTSLIGNLTEDSTSTVNWDDSTTDSTTTDSSTTDSSTTDSSTTDSSTEEFIYDESTTEGNATEADIETTPSTTAKSSASSAIPASSTVGSNASTSPAPIASSTSSNTTAESSTTTGENTTESSTPESLGTTEVPTGKNDTMTTADLTSENITTTEVPTTNTSSDTTEGSNTNDTSTTIASEETTGPTSSDNATTTESPTAESSNTTESTTIASEASKNDTTTTASPSSSENATTTESPSTAESSNTTEGSNTTASTTISSGETGNETTTTSGVASAENITTTEVPSTTASLNTTEGGHTTEGNETTTTGTTSAENIPTTEVPTTTEGGNTTAIPTTTEGSNTTAGNETKTTSGATSAENITTTEVPTITEGGNTTAIPTTTEGSNTTAGNETTTIESATSAENITTTEVSITTESLNTTEGGNTTAATTTEGSNTTTGNETTTTAGAISTENMTTTEVPTTTESLNTTEGGNTTAVPTTTEGSNTTAGNETTTTAGVPSADNITTTEVPTTTASLNTTEGGNTTAVPTTTEDLNTTTTSEETEIESSTTAGPATTVDSNTTAESNTTEIPATTVGTGNETTTTGATSAENVTTTEVPTTTESSNTTEGSNTTESTTITSEETSNETTTSSAEISNTTITTENPATAIGTTPWSLTSAMEEVTRRQCKPRLTCDKTTFGCCPDKKTAASGPFDAGCAEKVKACNETKHGCCPDGVSPAEGPDGEGCPVPSCSGTLYGCCTSDNKTAAEGNDQEGCPPPPPACLASTFGCCKDGETEATGPEKEGCPEMTTSTIAPTTIEESCLTSTHGCCYDNITEATGPNAEGCPCNSTQFGCCSDGVATAQGLDMAGCMDPCKNLTYGCCADGKTPAHGPDQEGCCLSSPFGCCPDNYKPADGPNQEGCGCEHAHFGCCPDKVTIARGANKEGCGCQYTEHGCCPDRHTEASGPHLEGCDCHTYQFGCCPDGVTVATGLNLQGCHCSTSKYGCCSDGDTPARGLNQIGCNCASSMFGCCSDGKTEAKGPNFYGCTELPINKQAACSLATDRGPCHNYSVYWYYDVVYGGCSRFWYGGCEGNGNRFDTKEECQDVCVQPPARDACKLPNVKGACVGYNIRWYYDSARQQCQQFNYGGCLGNANNFDTKELCEKKCEPEKTTDLCNLAIESGPCDGKFGRWAFNSEKDRCEQFFWGGCEGNTNRFTSETACMMRCKPPGTSNPRCTLPQVAGNCTDTQAMWSFSLKDNQCVPFYYTGCMGNDNSFTTFKDCTEACPSAYEPNECTLPAVTGECGNYKEKWYYDTITKMCSTFYYGGCGGNGNNFNTKEECEGRCFEPEVPDVEEPKTDTCQLPMNSGPCDESLMRWFYDSTSDSCSQFTYGGCEGNDNRFETRADCEWRCKTVLATTTTSSITTQNPTAVDDGTKVCQVSPALEQCAGAGEVWYLDPTRSECVSHINSGSGATCRTTGVFDSQDACERTCGVTKLNNECKLLPELGVCQSRYVMWFFDVNTHKCLQFVYSGCGGNNNRFETSNDCMSYCGTNAVIVTTTAATTIIISTTNSSIPITSTTSSSTPITSTPIITTISSDTPTTTTLNSSTPITSTPITTTISSDTPITSTLSSSIPITSTTSLTTPITTPPITSTTTPITTIVDELPEGCQASPALEQCAGAGEVWYLDPTRSECVSHVNSETGATCRTTGVFDSQEACERSCGVFRDIDVCRYAMEPGQCRNFVPKYYFDARTQSCKVFRYGGCLGGPNRFSTLDECMQVCRPYIEPCKQYPEAGNCNSRNIMWYYDESRDQCGQFIYTGCGGNNNRFESQNECEGQCKRQHIPRITTTSSSTTSSSTTSTSTTTSSTTITTRAPSSSAAVDELPEGCQASPALEQCAGAGEVWYLDTTRNECVLHINTDTGTTCRTTGVFGSQEACEHSCGVSSDVDPCKQYPEAGNCLSRYIMWYYDETRQQCGQFVYTGCGGNNNRFKSREDCEGQCRYPNNVEIITTTSAALSIVTPPTEHVNEECRIPESLVPCGTNVTVFYYDSNNKKCVESNIGGCRHANSYRTEEECERRCGAFRDINVCEARLDPGPCRDSITKFYWDPASGTCQSYAYGGCLGGSNRFSSIDECEEVCGSSGPDSNEVVPPNCDWYNEECSRLQCENGLVQTATADGCRRCSCKEVVDKCESARQECAALQCSYGVERFTDTNGCVGCRCLEHPCATLSCSAEEHCVVKVSQDPNTQESKYSAVCEMESNEIVPDCESFNEECAALRCSYAVQRTRTAHGCERCSCVQMEVDCAPHQQDCERLRCTYGAEKYKDADGCERCKCKKHPCDGVSCLPGERCVPNAYRDAVTQETKFNTACNVVNKPGTCPPEELASTESSCRQSCHDDADCRGVGKCCVRGCSRLCVIPATPTSPPPMTTPYAPDVPHAPQSLAETEPEVTASEGGKATLRCLFHANPPPKITWTRGEIKIDGNEGRYRLLSDGTLEIVSLYRNDSGVYICVADNGLGIARQEIRLQVNDPVKTSVGIAGEQNAVITGEFGRSLVLRCLAYGYPQPSVFWYRGLTGPMVPYSSTLYEARGNVLRIKKITYETLGEYACQAYNGEGRPALWAITVRAYTPPGFPNNPYFIDRENGIAPLEPDNEVIPVTTTSTTPEPDIPVFTVRVSTKLSVPYSTISAGAELSLPCEVDGYPDPDIHWTKDGVRLEPSTRISIAGTSVSRLTVYSVTLNDSGEYGCHAANQYSSHDSTAHITVQGLTIPAKCTDNKFFADCRLIVRSKFCKHKYYSKFCCKSCMEAGQLNSQDLEAQNDQSWSFRK